MSELAAFPRVDEWERVRTWRLNYALELGYSVPVAEIVARRRDIDLHDLDRIIHQGCAPITALEIYA